MQVAILNGVTMGGGTGVSIPGTFRVATDRTVCNFPSISSFQLVGLLDSSFVRLSNFLESAVTSSCILQIFATPETIIGFHPDAGASFNLSHLPGRLGMLVICFELLKFSLGLSFDSVINCWKAIFIWTITIEIARKVRYQICC